MIMNIHPIFVHFPIALLVAYSALEIATYLIPALRRQTWVFPVKAFLLLFGVASAFLALGTGETAEGLIADTSPRAYIIETHSAFAGATTITYAILAAAYLIRIFDMKGWGIRLLDTNGFFAVICRVKRIIARLVLDAWLLPLLALFGLACITITGALGAAIVYGPDIDPFVFFIYHFFWV